MSKMLFYVISIGLLEILIKVIHLLLLRAGLKRVNCGSNQNLRMRSSMNVISSYDICTFQNQKNP